MSKNQFTVGEVSKITGISKDTLRYYDKIGLFQPLLRDETTGYRLYTLEQFWYFDIITCFRKLGVSIKSIKEILSYKDNSAIVALLKEYKVEAERARDYYEGVVDDIEWYCAQNDKITHFTKQDTITVEHLKSKKVIYGINSENGADYHIRLQENCRDEILNSTTIKRNYGYFINPCGLTQNRFLVEGEYIEIGNGNHSYCNAHNLYTIPEGDYACFVTYVQKNSADFKPLVDWLKKDRCTTHFVIAEEIGLQLFYYNQYPYLCEIKALIKK